jgi:hypothetical protein
MRGTLVPENRAEELRLVVTHYGWDAPNLTPDEAAHVRDFMRQHFAFFHRGYRLEEVLIEVIGDEGLQMAQNVGFRLRRDYRVCYYDRGGDILPQTQLHPYLLGATRADVQPGGRSKGTVIEGAFAYLPARLLCVLTPCQHELLLLAISGADDAEIASMIGISRAGVKRRWLDLYRRLHDHYPDLFPTALEGTRLAEGRRRLLNYVRDTPGELRPIPFPESRRSQNIRNNMR